MNGLSEKSLYLGLMILMLLSSLACSTIMEPDGDAIAKPMIQNIENYKKNYGTYPSSLKALIPEYMGQYDFQAYRYQYFTSKEKDLDDLIKQGLILKGQGEGYTLAVRFQKYTGECIYINGVRQSCYYIGR